MTEPVPVCGRHKVPKEWRLTSFVYNDEGISICVPGVYGWVCPESGDASFPPDTVDELIAAVRELLDAARRTRERRSVLTQYVISVGESGAGPTLEETGRPALQPS